MRIDRFEDVLAWQEARKLNKLLYKSFHMLKNFSFRDQILRAGLSTTNNIAEGFERGGNRELRQFLVIARGSNAEVRSMLYSAKDCEYINSEEYTKLMHGCDKTGRLLTGFIKTIQPSHHKTIGPKK